MKPRDIGFGGEWTEQKLDCIRKYLAAYARIMSQQRFRFAYIDAFAGSGYRLLESDDKTGEILFPELGALVTES